MSITLGECRAARAALNAASPLTGLVSDRTASNTDATTEKAVATTPTPGQGALERARAIASHWSFLHERLILEIAAALTAAASEARAAGLMQAKDICFQRSAWAEDKIETEGGDDLWAGYSNACDDCATLIDDAARALATPAPDVRQRRHWISLARWRHKKRQSEYEILTSAAEAQCATGPINEGDHVTLYQADDGNWYVRKTGEFQDGRFERIDLATPAQSPPSLNTDIRALLQRASDQLCHYATDYPQPEALHLINVIDRVLGRGHYTPAQSET